MDPFELFKKGLKYDFPLSHNSLDSKAILSVINKQIMSTSLRNYNKNQIFSSKGVNKIFSQQKTTQ